jgi:hypothetical protein
VKKFLLESSMDNADTVTERMQRQKIHKLREYQFADEQWEAQRLKTPLPIGDISRSAGSRRIIRPKPDAWRKGPKLPALLASFADVFLLWETDALFFRETFPGDKIEDTIANIRQT